MKTRLQVGQDKLNECFAKIRYLEKIKEELTLKFKDISNEIIKAQHESFSAEQKTFGAAVAICRAA